MQGSYIPVCGRPTLKGTACQNPQDLGGACARHLTPEERAILPRVEMPTLLPERTEPACWAWALPDEDLGLVGDVLLIYWQAGRCAVCGESPGYELYRDHDHQTGMIRGLLCRSCNGREAGHHPSYSLFGRYRHSNPCSLLGIRVRYVHPFTGEAANG